MRILLLDDDDGFRYGVAENLRDDGHEVTEFAGPRDVPPLSALGRVDVVITDYEMSPEDMDGLSFADAVAREQPGAPVVLVTAFVTPNLEAEVARRPWVHLCAKPCRYDELHDLVLQLGRAAA
ncbi:MAG: response regulator [Candidatus Binatia bacterium]